MSPSAPPSPAPLKFYLCLYLSSYTSIYTSILSLHPSKIHLSLSTPPPPAQTHTLSILLPLPSNHHQVVSLPPPPPSPRPTSFSQSPTVYPPVRRTLALILAVLIPGISSVRCSSNSCLYSRPGLVSISPLEMICCFRSLDRVELMREKGETVVKTAVERLVDVLLSDVE